MNRSKFYKFPLENKEFIYSGYTGLLLENNSEIDSFIDKKEENEELQKLLIGNDEKRRETSFYPEPVIKGITVFTTNFCNLACSYCYNRTNQIADSKCMDFNQFVKSINYILNNLKYKNSISISYFGGEPLSNFDFIKKSVDYVKSIEDEYKIKFNFGITTNGTLLNENNRQFLLENNFGIMISMDGEKEVHNSQRKFINGKGSYDTIIKNVEEISKYARITARATICNFDTDFVYLYKELTAHGFDELNIDLASAVESLKNETLKKELLSAKLKELADYVICSFRGKNMVNITNFTRVLLSLHKGDYRSFPCSAGASDYTLSAEGDIYLCHRFNNIDEYKWGNFFEGIDNDKRSNFLRKHSVDQRNECKSCWASRLCGGDCYHTSYMENGSTDKISSLHCYFKKEIIKNSIYIYASLDEEDRVIFDNMN